MKKSIKLQVIFLLFVAIFNLFTTPFLIIAYAYSNPEYDHSDVYRKNENQYKKIALTFDDGPHPRITPKILEILDKYNVKATFFTVGINVHYYPETFESILSHGHEIGNHTYTHPHVARIDTGTLKILMVSMSLIL